MLMRRPQQIHRRCAVVLPEQDESRAGGIADEVGARLVPDAAVIDKQDRAARDPADASARFDDEHGTVEQGVRIRVGIGIAPGRGWRPSLMSTRNADARGAVTIEDSTIRNAASPL